MTDVYIDDVRHLVPRADLIEHEIDTAGDCICGPTAQIICRDGDSDLHRYVHHPLDVRLTARQ